MWQKDPDFGSRQVLCVQIPAQVLRSQPHLCHPENGNDSPPLKELLSALEIIIKHRALAAYRWQSSLLLLYYYYCFKIRETLSRRGTSPLRTECRSYQGGAGVEADSWLLEMVGRRSGGGVSKTGKDQWPSPGERESWGG